MATCKVGNSPIQSAYWGNNEIEKIYNGSNLIYEAIPPVVPQTCTVDGLGSASPSSVSFTKTSGFTVAGLGIEEITFSGDIFIKIPTMYRKVESVSNNQITSFTISNVKIDNNYVPYSCFVDESGNELPYILIGKYWNTSSTDCISTTQTYPSIKNTNTVRTYAKNKGNQYQLFDWQMLKLWQDLIICFKETVNTNSGTAWTFDELGIYWTTDMQTHGSFIDGIIGGPNYWYFSYKPSEYVSLTSTNDSIPSTYLASSYTRPSNYTGEIMTLGYDTTNPFLNFAKAATSNTSYNTFYCDYYNYDPSGNRNFICTPSLDSAMYGVYHCATTQSWESPGAVRLCYRPIQ